MHTRRLRLFAIACFICTTLFAADGNWIAGSGVWGDTANWAGGTVASGAGYTAWFTNAIAADASIFPYAPQTIGNIIVNDADGSSNVFSIRDGSNAFTIAVASGSPLLNCATRLNLLPVVYGNQGFTKLGPGVLNIGLTSNFISGPVNLYQGSEILLNNYQALQFADVTVTGTLVNSRKQELNTKTLFVGQDGKVNMLNTDIVFSNQPVYVKAERIIVGPGGQLGAGLSPVLPTVGEPFALLAPSIVVSNGGQIRANVDMDATSAQLHGMAGISGSNITVMSGGDIMFAAHNAVFTIDNPLTLAGAGTFANIGALLTAANNVNLTNNSPITLAGNTTIGQFGVGGYMVLNQPIGGTGSLTLHAQAASGTHTKRYELFASNTYAGTTVLNTLYCSTDFNLRGHQRLPHTNGVWASDAALGTSTLALDLHGYNQTFGQIDMNGAGHKVVRSTGGAGTLTFDNAYGYGFVMSDGGTLIIDGGVVSTPGYLIVRDNCELLVTGGVLNVGLEILNGFAGSTGTVTVADKGEINCYVVLNGDGIGLDDEPSFLNLCSGGVLRTAAFHVFGTGDVVASVINFDGGLLSDGYYGEWGNSYSNWIMTLTNLVVHAGGARIEANSALRGINQSLRHAPALGAVPDGGLTKRGGGTLRLGAPNSYTGPTIIENGTLQFAVPDSLPAASKYIGLAGGNCDVMGLADSTLHVDAGRTLVGNGIIAGLLDVGANGIVRPGASLGIISVSSNVAFGAGATYHWEIGPDGNADTIVADGALLLPGGVNVVTVQVGVAGAPAVESNTFVLCSAVGGVSGSPDCFYMDYGMTGIGGPEHPTIDGADVLVELYVPEPALCGLLALALFGLLRKVR